MCSGPYFGVRVPFVRVCVCACASGRARALGASLQLCLKAYFQLSVNVPCEIQATNTGLFLIRMNYRREFSISIHQTAVLRKDILFGSSPLYGRDDPQSYTAPSCSESQKTFANIYCGAVTPSGARICLRPNRNWLMTDNRANSISRRKDISRCPYALERLILARLAS